MENRTMHGLKHLEDTKYVRILIRNEIVLELSSRKEICYRIHNVSESSKSSCSVWGPVGQGYSI